MKKIIFILALALCSCLNTFSQATSLTIDNQTPGWLSSKINYGDQKTLENIKVSGYINSSDISFIGSLILNHSLHGIIDLSDAEITSELTQQMFGINIFNNSSQIEIKYLSLPTSMTSPEGCGLLNGLRIDTLEVGGYNYKTIMKNDFYYPNGSYPSNANAKNVKIREGVEVIGKNAFAGARTSINYDNTYLEAITLPNSMKRIENGAFSNCTSLNYFELPDSIEYLGSASFVSSLIPDTFHLPKMLKTFNASNFASCYKYGLFLHIPENVDTIIGADCETYCNYEYTQKGRTPSYLKIDCKTPPRALTSSFSGYHLFFSRFSWECVYVPKGTLEAYQSAYYVPNNNITNFVEYIEVEKIEIPSMMKLYVGDYKQMSAIITPEDAMNKKIKWESNNPSIVEVSEDGTIKAIAYGTADITATTEDGGYEATCSISVFEHTTGVEMVDKISIPIDKTYTLNAKTLPLSTSDGNIIYSSENEEIAIVNTQGVVTAKKKGTCTITATSVDGGFTANCEVTVTQPVETLTLEKHSTSLKVGETENLYAQIAPATADDKTMAWASSDEQIAMVDNNGKVTAIKAGEAWIKAISNDNAEAKDSCKVTVIQPVTGVTLSMESFTFNNAGETKQLTATVAPEDASNREVRWSSSNENVCVVSNGLVTAVAAGTATVTVTTVDGNFTAICIVKVLQHVAKVELNKSALTLKVGDTDRLSATVSPDNAEDKTISWSSSNEDVATIDAGGNVTAIKAGEAWIKAVSVDNAEAKDSCKVSVTQPVTGITLNYTSYQLNDIGDSFTLEATLEPDDASNKNVKWKSSNESLCIVSNGQVIAVGIGTCVIIATTEDGGHMATCTVTVTNATGISSAKNINNESFQIYDIQGNKLSHIQKGINVIRMKDGSTRKVLVKLR